MLRSLFVLALIPFMLTACGKSASENTAEKVDEANTKLTRMQEINIKLATSYGLVLNAKDAVTTAELNETNEKAMRTLSRTRLIEAQTLTAEFIALNEQALGIIGKDGVTYTGKRESLERALGTARKVYGDITAGLSNSDQSSVTSHDTCADISGQYRACRVTSGRPGYSLLNGATDLTVRKDILFNQPIFALDFTADGKPQSDTLFLNHASQPADGSNTIECPGNKIVKTIRTTDTTVGTVEGIVTFEKTGSRLSISTKSTTSRYGTNEYTIVCR